MMTKVKYINLGLIDYKEAWDYQEKLFAENIQRKIDKRNNVPTEETENYLIFCEHPHVYTLGKSGDANHLLLNDEFLKKIEATYYKINRGGDITYHGPGQLIMYPIFDLDYFFTDIHKYMRFLEEAVIQTLAHYGIESGRSSGFTGVWLDAEKPTARKICAMGVRSSRWVTMHGIGFNINSNLDYFNHIVPCGIADKGVTSLAKELGRNVEIDEVIDILKEKMATLFNFELTY
ncbi:MAG TPA: lipoyl(octanoyl) transferase LipB [Crocinitomicaceae bacterium]|nr:lipoyl(octanoyl) transferase LipB [Crocinitomicaceae bacterium]